MYNSLSAKIKEEIQRKQESFEQFVNFLKSAEQDEPYCLSMFSIWLIIGTVIGLLILNIMTCCGYK